MSESLDFDDAFAIDASTGEITVAEPNYFDFEQTTSVTGTVLVSAGTVTKEVNVTVTLTNVHEITMDNIAITTAENAAAGSYLASLEAETTNEGSVTFTLSNISPADAIEIGFADAGAFLRVKNASKFNYELHPTITAVVRASSTSGPDFVEATVTITLTDVSETVQERLDDGETPLQIFTSNNSLVNQLFAKNYAGGIIGAFNTTTGSCLILSGEQAGSYTAGAALTAANDLILNGYDDWRLPTETEANSLNFAISTGTNVLPTGSGAGYWTSTTCGGICVKAFYIGSTALGIGSEPASNTHPLMAIRIQN
jgi:hypothetical protein